MKLQVLLALVATAQAGDALKAGCVVKAGNDAAIDGCKCHADCKLCVGADKAKAEVATACSTCTDAKKEVKEATAGSKVGSCKEKSGDSKGGDAKGKATKGQPCDQNAAEKGCADGLQCGKTTAAAGAAEEKKDGGE